MSKTAQGTLGLTDVIAGAVLFLALSVGLQKLLDAAVPGLLKPETLVQIQISGVIFLLVWAVFGNLVFKPFLDLVAEREEKTVGSTRHAAEKKRESRSLEQKVEEELREARLEGIQQRDKLAEAARKQSQQVLEAADAAAREEIRKAQLEIDELKSRAEQELAQEAAALAELVVKRALTPVSSEHYVH